MGSHHALRNLNALLQRCDASSYRISSKVDDLLVSLYSVYIHAHTPGVTYCVHIITDGSIEESHVAWLAKRCALWCMLLGVACCRIPTLINTVLSTCFCATFGRTVCWLRAKMCLFLLL